MIILIDNYDSFTFNIFHYVNEFNKEIYVYRNDKITIDQIKKINPKAIIISPGPGIPDNAGICVNLIKELHKYIPILGICLGHQAIGRAFGSKIISAPNIHHGKISIMNHNGNKIFKGLNKKFHATRYHSLIIDKNTLSNNLKIISYTDDKLIMGICHKKYKVYGLQFHPESIGTTLGKRIFQNFINLL